MARNIEIKANVADPQLLREKVLRLADAEPMIITQTDTYFTVPNGRLKLRRFADRSAELIYYQRENVNGPNISTYDRVDVTEPDRLSDLLKQAIGVCGEIRKTRELWMIGQTRVHLDDVEDLGHFVELEVALGDDQSQAEGEQIAGHLMEQLMIAKEHLVAQAYIDLL